jgi:hypothetical protein
LPKADAGGTEWYLARDGQQYGPISETELRKLLELKQLKDDDLLWCDGLDDWKPVAQIGPELTTAPARQQADAEQQISAEPEAALQPEAALPQEPQQPAVAVSVSEPLATSARAAQAAQPREPAPVEVTAPLPPPGAAYGHTQHGSPGAQPQRAPDVMWRAPHEQGPAPAAQYPYGSPPAGRHRESSPHPGANPAHAQWSGQASAPYPAAQRRPATAMDAAAEQRRGRRREAPARNGVPDDQSDEAPSRRGLVWVKRAAIILFFATTLSAAGWYLYPYRDHILGAATSVIPVREDPAARVPPMAGFAADPAQTDEALQKALLWRTLKREFPEWYEQQLGVIRERVTAGEDAGRIGAHLLNEIAQLRRKNALNALSATPPRLRAIASTLTDALVRVTTQSVDSCHAVVTAGEAGPQFFDLVQSPELTAALQIHLSSIFEAIAEGRRTPRVWPQPKDDDFGILVVELEALGWSQNDLRLFSDNAKLAAAPPSEVCRLVTQWYQGQLRVKDPEIQLRLLADALRPLISG